MSREADVVARLRADATLAAILTGGIYSSEILGFEGVTDPLTTPDAYANGLMRPLSLVRERGEVDDTRIYDQAEQVVAESIVVEVWLYERITSAAIKAAKDRIFVLLQGYRFTRAWPAVRVFSLPVLPEPQLTGVMVARVDYQVTSVRGN